MGWECVFFFPIPRGLFLELEPNYLITNSKVIFISNYFCEELIYLITNLRLFSPKKKRKKFGIFNNNLFISFYLLNGFDIIKISLFPFP